MRRQRPGIVGRALCDLWDSHRWVDAGGNLLYCQRCGLVTHAPLSPEELDAIEAMPVYLVNGLLPEGAPSAEVLNRLAGRGIIVLLTDGAGDRWSLAVPGDFERRGFGKAGWEDR